MLKNFSILKFILLLFVFMSSMSHAIQYNYHDSLSLSLGSGFDPSDLTESRQDCLEWDDVVRSGGIGSRKSDLSFEFVQSKKNMYQKVGVSAEVSAKTYFLKGNAQSSFLDQFSFDQETIHVVTSASFDFGKYHLQNPRLKPAYQKLIDQGYHKLFSTYCGTHYTSTEIRGASLIAVYTFTRVTEDQMTEFKASIAGSGSAYGVSAGASVGFEGFAKKMNRNSQMDLKVFTIGAGGVSELKNVINDPENVKNLLNQLNAYVTSLKPEQGTPLSYLGTSMEAFGWKNDVDVDFLKQDQTISEQFFAVSTLLDLFNRVNAINLKRNTDYVYLQDGDIERFTKELPKIATEIARLSNEARDCLHDCSTCHISAVQPFHVELPLTLTELRKEPRIAALQGANCPSFSGKKFNFAECDFARRAGIAQGCISHRESRGLNSLNLAPRCTDEIFTGTDFCN